MKLYLSDCLDILGRMKSDSVDSIVCDPPYGISMGGLDWDKSLPPRDIWRECFRVLKPGGHIMAFSSSRLYHHLATDMEATGFDTHNMMAWLYGNGFPKGENLSRQFDRRDGLPVPDDLFRSYLRSAIKGSSYKIAELEKMCGTSSMFSHYLGRSQPAFPTFSIWKILKEALGLDSTYDSLFEKLEERRKECASKKEGRRKSKHFESVVSDFERHRPRSELAKKWEGWRYGKNTLRPAMEPIYLGQKPPLRPVSGNVKRYGVGALNVKGCGVRGRDGKVRTPTNVMHDGSGEVVRCLEKGSKLAASSLNEFPRESDGEGPFFYVPKCMGKERANNSHLTVKPISLMRQLVRLITPRGGVCVDPFMGSGTTGVACVLEGMEFIGMEKETEYYEIAKNRIEEATASIKKEKVA